jgi:hypothetical protein
MLYHVAVLSLFLVTVQSQVNLWARLLSVEEESVWRNIECSDTFYENDCRIKCKSSLDIVAIVQSGNKNEHAAIYKKKKCS